MILATERLVLRAFREDDVDRLHALVSDPAVMREAGAVESREQAARRLAGYLSDQAHHGFAKWAVETAADRTFVGYCGFGLATFDGVEVPELGFRLLPGHWGRGYATEAARAALEYGFRDLELEQIVSFTTAANLRSRAVMDRIGMTRSPEDDFDHPALPEGHPLRRHVLYRATRSLSPT